MRQDIPRTFENQSVPRYTSYPTSPHFTQPIDDTSYRQWLNGIAGDAPISLYLHVPFCRSLRWYCGCHTKIVDRDARIADYVAALRREIDLVAEALSQRLKVGSDNGALRADPWHSIKGWRVAKNAWPTLLQRKENGCGTSNIQVMDGPKTWIEDPRGTGGPKRKGSSPWPRS